MKIGYLVDIDSGALLGDCLDAAILACEDALADGDLFRPIELVPKIARGLPRAEARIAVAGYEELCDEGCLVVLGPYITDNGMDQLSYKAASNRNTNTMLSAIRYGACDPDWISCSDCPVHS